MAMETARGTFRVTLTPQPPAEGSVGAALSRMAIDKRFEGDLDATSRGEMLAVRTDVEGSAGYVAMEWVEGTLGGRTGRFAFQHSGTLDRGRPQLAIAVVPDSASGGLAGLAGTMTIVVEGGAHAYEFTYRLPDGG